MNLLQTSMYLASLQAENIFIHHHSKKKLKRLFTSFEFSFFCFVGESGSWLVVLHAQKVQKFTFHLKFVSFWVVLLLYYYIYI